MWHDFKWIDWNIEHIAHHGLSVDEVEFVVNSAVPPFPKSRRDDSYAVIGPTRAGLWIQVLYTAGADGRLFVFHARPSIAREAREAQREIRNARG